MYDFLCSCFFSFSLSFFAASIYLLRHVSVVKYLSEPRHVTNVNQNTDPRAKHYHSSRTHTHKHGEHPGTAGLHSTPFHLPPEFLRANPRCRACQELLIGLSFAITISGCLHAAFHLQTAAINKGRLLGARRLSHALSPRGPDWVLAAG